MMKPAPWLPTCSRQASAMESFAATVNNLMK
jgi:hypothetical protein